MSRARGGTGRPAGFRFQYRKMWGFDSLRAHHRNAPLVEGDKRALRSAQSVRAVWDYRAETVETENQGLKRAFMLTIPAEDIEARVNAEVKRIAPQVRMPGFRPGKVPPNLIKKMHGDAIQRDALQG